MSQSDSVYLFSFSLRIATFVGILSFLARVPKQAWWIARGDWTVRLDRKRTAGKEKKIQTKYLPSCDNNSFVRINVLRRSCYTKGVNNVTWRLFSLGGKSGKLSCSWNRCSWLDSQHTLHPFQRKRKYTSPPQVTRVRRLRTCLKKAIPDISTLATNYYMR